MVPELNKLDPTLAEADRQLLPVLSRTFRSSRAVSSRFGSLCPMRVTSNAAPTMQPYLYFCRQHGFFRMPIPRDLGGEGRCEADDYCIT